MRVYDLAKELGKDSSKEVLDILEKHNINLKSSSNVTDEHVAIVKKEMGGRPQGSSPARSSEPAGEGDAPKKKIAAVYRPQNAQMKPQGQGQGGREVRGQQRNDSRPSQAPGQGGAPRDYAPRGQQTSEQTGAGEQGNREPRPQGQGGYQGNREGRPQGQGGYQGNREGRPQGQGGYQGNREGRP
ncbi:MAG: translation initiation factor IF-2 N-terminal domain-containing protein, partial [Lacrimispora sp.]|uniref:translation initiation factor IF-2 N-terminal domain-containing protein n=1 Tax=Lacrimispora sp. TaxID=2719234 RepID=UPI0039E4C96E